jgi:hypothetical protein
LIVRLARKLERERERQNVSSEFFQSKRKIEKTKKE